MQKFENHILYSSSFCPFCIKVQRFMKNNDIECEVRNTSEPGVREELISIGGKSQVPCLVIGDKAMYESSDIIQYFSSKLS